jgi:2-polyprenyl-6-methoxyphenol hydroxylase-like FAD-dependent oxidoreductase
MQILRLVREKSIFMRGASWVDGRGTRFATMPADFFEARDAQSLEIMRGDLSHILYEATRGDVEYIFGDSIASLAESGDGLHVRFESGNERMFDLVVGADGVHSNVRALAIGEEAEVVDDLGGYYVSTFTVPNRMKLDGWDLFHFAPGKTMNLSSIREDADAVAVFLFASPRLAYDRRDVAAQKRLVAEVFAREGWEVPWLLGVMRDAGDFFFDDVCQIRMDRWSRGRAVLIGDAGYAPSLASGQGTSLALVGAYVLAGELKAAGGDHAVAFGRYEEQMRGFVERNQRLGKDGIKAMVLHSRWQIWFTSLLLRWIPHMPWKAMISRHLKRWVHRAATAIVLRDYSNG